jgi:predicted nucleotidyltransferase
MKSVEEKLQLLQRDALAVLREHRDEILRLARRRGVSSIRIFGSVSRGDAGPASDLDFLVELEPGYTLVDLGGLQMDLKELLGHEVDLVEPAALHPLIRDRILAEAVPI